MIDHLDHDDEAYSLMMRLVMGNAENARLDGEDLREHGFEPVQVVGLDRVLWKQDDGPLDGALFTEQAALSKIRPTIQGPEEGQPRWPDHATSTLSSRPCPRRRRSGRKWTGSRSRS